MISPLHRSVLVILFLATIPCIARAQSCNPAVVSYLVRDEKGTILSDTDLKSVAASLPKTVGDAQVNTSNVSFTEDKQTYYWPESVDWEKGTKQPALQFANAATCTMTLAKVSLEYHGKQMHLIFNLSIERNQPDRRIVIDSLPFQEGTFELDLNGWSRDPERMIPSARWKKAISK